MTLLQIINEDLPVTDLMALSKIASKLFWRFIIDMLTMFILVRFIYYPNYKNKELFFTFYIFNFIIFLLSFLLNKVDLSMGAAFGLFAVFSMLRYRTEDVSIKDMTYLFLSIAVGLISAVAKIKGANDLYENFFLVMICATVLVTTFVLESRWISRREASKIIIYENIELIKADKHTDLLIDLNVKTGITVHRFSIQKIDFLKDAAQIKVYYYE